MEFRQLEYFIAVCRQKSFTRASEALFVSQPAITSAINNLENELGIKLFNRTKRNVELTMEGQTFYRHVSAVLSDVDHILLQMNQLREQKNHVLRIAVDSFLALPVFLPLYRWFQEKYPQIRLSCFYCGCSELPAALEREEYQIGIALGDSDSFHSGRLKAQKVLSGRLLAVSGSPKEEVSQILLMNPGYTFTKKAAAFFQNRSGTLLLSYSSNFTVTAEILRQDNSTVVLPDFLLPFLPEREMAQGPEQRSAQSDERMKCLKYRQNPSREPVEIPDIEANIYLVSGAELSENASIFYHDMEEFIRRRQFL